MREDRRLRLGRVELTGDRIAAAVLVLGAAVFLGVRLGASLVGSRVFVGMDVLRLYEPFSFPDNHPVTSFYYVTDQLDGMLPSMHEIHQRFLHGDWASWSNLVTGGGPLLGQPTLGVVTPGRILYLLMPTALVPGWSKLIELCLAWTFTYLFVRRLNGTKLAAALAGAIYPLTGFMIGWNNYPQVAVGAMIPMLFWAVERYVQQPSVRSVAPVAVASAFLMFGGFPAVAGQAFYVVGGYAILRVVSANRRRVAAILTRLGWLAAACAVGVGITAFQLVPFAHQVLSGVNLGYRSNDFFNHTRPAAALTAFLPKSFATNTLCCSYSPQDINAYVGAVVLFLALLGILQAVWGRLQGSAGVYLVGVIVAVLVLIWFQGWWTSWMDNLPIFHGNPIGRVRSQLGLPVAVLAAGGFDFLRAHRWSQSWWRRELPESRLVAALVAFCTGALVLGSGLALALHRHGWVATRTIEQDTLIAGVPLAIIAVLALLASGSRSRGALMTVVVLGVLGQGFVATSYYWPTAPRSEFYPSDAGISYLQSHQGDDRVITTGYTMRANVTAYYGIRAYNGHAFLDPKVKALTLAAYPAALLGPTYTAFSTDLTADIHNPALDRMGVRYVVAGVDDALPATQQPVPIPGTPDPLRPSGAQRALVPNTSYRAALGATTAVRGVNIALQSTRAAILTVTLRSADGAVVTSDSRRVPVGSTTLPVPLADDPAAPAPAAAARPLDVDVAVDGPGVSADFDDSGAINVQPVRPPAVNDGARLAYAGAGLVIWERRDYLPRIRWASRAEVIPDPTSRLNAVAHTTAEPGSVILNAPAASTAPSAVASPAALTVVQDTGDQMSVHVTASAPGWVVVADSLQPNFAATVDGHRAGIVEADYAGGAVYVPAGTHTVVLRYHPPSGTAAVAISAASVGALLVALLPFGRIRRLRRRRPV